MCHYYTGVSGHADHCGGSQASQLGGTIDCFPSLAACIAPSGTPKASPQRRAFRSRPAHILPVLFLKCTLSLARVLPSTSGRQPMATSTIYIVLGVSLIPPPKTTDQKKNQKQITTDGRVPIPQQYTIAAPIAQGT